MMTILAATSIWGKLTNYWDSLSGLPLVYGICALVGGVLFLIQFTMLIIGMEFDIDALADGSGHFSLQGLSGFFALFGITGLFLHSNGYSAFASSAGGLGAGMIMMLLVGKLIYSMRKLESSGNVTMDKTVGSKGTVYAQIAPGESGEVTVTIGNKSRQYEAVTDHPEGLDTGDRIEVIEVVAGNLVKVQKLNSNKKEKA